MDETRTYPSGVPCWIDLEPPEPDAARHFYGELLGWTFEDVMPAGAPGYYWVASLDGHAAAAIGPPLDGAGATAWNTYVAVDSADEGAAAVTAAGGQVTVTAQDAGPGGRYAVCTDPSGAAFRLWQARRRPGAQVVNVPGAWNFSDLHTDDLAGATAFYGGLFGWEAGSIGDEAGPILWRRPGYGEHLAATVDPAILRRHDGTQTPPGFADAVAFLAPIGRDEEPHWHVTFAVADRDAAMATALRLGARDRSGPVDTDWTRLVVVEDPQGAAFTLSQFTPPS